MAGKFYRSENKAKSTNLPEPYYLSAGPGVVPVDGVSLPVIQINFLHSTEKHLEGRKSEINTSYDFPSVTAHVEKTNIKCTHT